MTDTRPELEEERRFDYLEYQKSAVGPRVSERTMPSTDEEEDRQTYLLADNSVTREVNTKINLLIKGDFGSDLNLDKDVFERIEEIRRIKQAEGIKQVMSREDVRLRIGMEEVNDNIVVEVKDINKEHIIEQTVNRNKMKISGASYERIKE